MKEFFLSRDNDSHWFVVEATKEKEWEAWLALDQNAPEAWEPPPFANEVGGAPSRVRFQNPRFL